MDTNSSRSKFVHNYALPQLKWGNQRVLRCAKETENPIPESVQFLRCRVSNILPPSYPESKKSSPLNRGIGIDEVREKLTLDLKTAADKMKISILEETQFHESIPNDDFEKSKSRKRSRKPEEPRAKLTIPLTQEEIKNDFLAITGNLPARRPKKRSRIVQKRLNTILPGLWLRDITPEDYK